MKSWQVLFREGRAGRDSDAQGGSTGEDDFLDEAGDDAAALEGEAELDGDDEVENAELEADDEQSDEDQDESEEDEDEVEEVEKEETGFRFKDPKSGDFDFKRINKVVGGDALEKAFKEQNATITRTFQELKSYKDLADSPKAVLERTHKAGFLDRVMNENPGIRAKITRILETGNFNVEDSGEQEGGWQVPQGADPGDPLLNPLQQLHQTVYSIQNQLQMEQNRKMQEHRERQFSEGLSGARARFKEMTGGKEMSDEQAELVAKDMREMGVLNGARFVPDLFWKEIEESKSEKRMAQRSVKKNLPKVGASRRPAPGTQKNKPREVVRDELWNEHMDSDD